MVGLSLSIRKKTFLSDCCEGIAVGEVIGSSLPSSILTINVCITIEIFFQHTAAYTTTTPLYGHPVYKCTISRCVHSGDSRAHECTHVCYETLEITSRLRGRSSAMTQGCIRPAARGRSRDPRAHTSLGHGSAAINGLYNATQQCRDNNERSQHGRSRPRVPAAAVTRTLMHLATSQTRPRPTRPRIRGGPRERCPSPCRRPETKFVERKFVSFRLKKNDLTSKS